MTRAQKRHLFHHRYAVESLVISGVMWLTLLGFALMHGGARWPTASYDVLNRDIIAPRDMTVHKGDILIPAGTHIPAQFAEVERWVLLFLLIGIVEFTWIKAYAMGRRMDTRDWLTISLISALLSLIWFFFYLTMINVYPAWGFMTFHGRLALYLPIALTKFWCAVQLIRVPDQPEGSG